MFWWGIVDDYPRFSSFTLLGSWVTYIWVPETQDITGQNTSLELLEDKCGLGFWKSFPWRYIHRQGSGEGLQGYPGG